MSATLTLRATGAPLELPRARTVRVHSADQLRRAMREARDHQPLALDASALACLLRTDDARRLLEVQGAMTWKALANGLGQDGERLAPWIRSAGLPATVAQAVSADAAGPDGAPLAAAIEAIALVTLDGELRRVDRERQDELFRLVIGGQGLFGLIYSVTLRLEVLLRAAERALPAIEIDLRGSERAGAAASDVEVLLPPERVEEFLHGARRLAAERRFALRRVAVSRLRKGAETALSWATRDWAGVTLRLELGATLGSSVHATEIRRQLHAHAIARDGSFPVRAAHGVSRAQLDACYPQLPAFLAQKRRYDPAERLQNAWYRDVMALLRCDTCDSRWEN